MRFVRDAARAVVAGGTALTVLVAGSGASAVGTERIWPLVFDPMSGTFSWVNPYPSGGSGPTGSFATGAAVGSIAVAGSYDGDLVQDLAVYEPPPLVGQTGTFRIFQDASSGTASVTQQLSFGAFGDIPVVGDFSGDGKADPGVFRPSNGTWYWKPSGTTNPDGTIVYGSAGFKVHGAPGDQPVPGNFAGDAKTDWAVYTPSTGEFWVRENGATIYSHKRLLGDASDIPSPFDVDGDSLDDMAVFTPGPNGTGSAGRWSYRSSMLDDPSSATDNLSVPFDGPLLTSNMNLYAANSLSDVPMVGNYGSDTTMDQSVLRMGVGYYARWQTYRLPSATTVWRDFEPANMGQATVAGAQAQPIVWASCANPAATLPYFGVGGAGAKKTAYIGDSITFLSCRYLQGELQKTLAVRGKGVSGAQLDDALDAQNHALGKAQAQFVADPVSYAVINLGTNDVVYSPANVANDKVRMRTLVEQYLSPPGGGAGASCVELVTVNEQMGYSPAVAAELNAYYRWLAGDIADGSGQYYASGTRVEVVDWDAQVKGTAANSYPQGQQALFGTDLVHPNHTGMAVLSYLVRDSLASPAC